MIPLMTSQINTPIVTKHGCFWYYIDTTVQTYPEYVKCVLAKWLWFLFKPRINLSPFTKDFRGEEQYNESMTNFFCLALAGQ